jgi:hypothetical protein
MKRFVLTTYITLGVFLICTQTALAVQVRSLPITTYSSDGSILRSSEITLTNDTGGATIAVADLGTDGTLELIVGHGLGNDPRVHFLRQDGSEILSFLAYADNFGRGVTVAACDLDGDGPAEVVTGTQYGGGPQVRVFDNYGNVKFDNGFFAYAEDFRGGVNVACGDVDNDGVTEIVTTPGPTGGPHVRVWEWFNNSWQLDQQFFAYDANDANGVDVLIENENGINKLVVSHATGDNNDKTFYLISENKTATVDKVVSTQTSFAIDETKYNITVADLDADGSKEVVAVPGDRLEGPAGDKHIIVDISEQRLFAYENGLLNTSFFISSGTWWFPTPLGNHSVLAKKPWVDYTWNYGAGSSENYSMGLTPWNLMFQNHYYIHSAPWHNNFGERMSHGCVNASTSDAEWIYNFADTGTPVDIVE